MKDKSQKVTYIHKEALPLSCPSEHSQLWREHPRVYLPIEEAKDGKISCPYCGQEYILKSCHDAVDA